MSKFLEQMQDSLGALADTDLLYIRRPTADKTIRDIKITWAELKAAMGISVGTITSVFGRSTTAITAQASDYDASQVDNDSGVSGVYVSDALDQLDTDIATKAGTAQTELISGYVDAPGNGDLDIIIKTPIGFTIQEITTKAVSGSITATWKIDGVALGGAANAVSTSEETQVHASANAIAVDEDLSVTTSSDASCTGFHYTMKVARTLA